MTFMITITTDEDGMVIVECPAIPGCVSQGATRDEAERNITDAIRETLAARRDLGLPPTIEITHLDVAV